MPSKEIQALTDAIDGLKTYYGDSRWAEVLKRANELEADVKDLMGSVPEMSPGQEAARESATPADRPKALKDEPSGDSNRDKADDGGDDAPKNFRDASEKASKRFQSRDDGSARGDDATADDKKKEG